MEHVKHTGKMEYVEHTGKMKHVEHTGKIKHVEHTGKMKHVEHTGKISFTPSRKLRLSLKPFSKNFQPIKGIMLRCCTPNFSQDCR